VGLSFADLLTQESISVIRARLVAALKDDGFPTDSWAPSSAGGVENMRLDLAAGVGAYMPPRIVAFVNGRILPLATGDYLKALGARFYGLGKRDPSKTIENLALYAVGSGGSYTFQPGDLWVRSDATGHRYQSITGGQFSPANTGPPTPVFPGNPLMLQFEAELAGAAYSDPAGTITTLVTARAGVRCINIAPADFTDAIVNGPSSGKVIAKFATPGLAPAFSSIRVAIETTGMVGSAAFSYSIDGGVTWVDGGPVAASITIPASSLGTGGALVTFANSTVNPSFIAGDTFTMFLGDPILQRGHDAESDIAFRRRCANRWPSLSDVPVAATIDLWAHEASPEVDKVSVDADPNTSGGILVIVASATGPASAAAQIAVEDYIAPRLRGYQGVPAPATTGFTSPAESVIVSSAEAFDVIASGPVRVPKAQLATAQVTANNNWNDYLASLPLGGQLAAVIELAELAKILADAGAIDIPDAYANLLLNGVSADLVIPAGLVAVPAPGQSLLTSIVWIPA
jgi:hypothetical protein